MDIENIKNLLKRYGLKPNFTYGQNFLIDDIVLEDITDTAEVASNDQILEIGPGIGNLTRRLCEKAGLVLSIEKDPKFIPLLKAIKKDHKNFRWEIADILEFDYQKFFLNLNSPPLRGGARGGWNHDDENIQLLPPTNLPHQDHPIRLRRMGNPDQGGGKRSYKVVANIPYYITGKILRMLMAAKYKPSTITLLTQKEVAQNIVAQAGDLSVLAISVQLFGEPSILKIVQAKSFFPVPKVDSAILSIKLFKKPKYDIGDEKNFFRIVKACFAGKRKQIHNTLKNNLGLSKERADEILAKKKIDPAARPQELSIGQWIDLSKNIK